MAKRTTAFDLTLQPSRAAIPAYKWLYAALRAKILEGRLRPELNAMDAFAACFPAGTLSGAPKVRAMQIISELEQTQRGPYGGCVGYFSFNGNLDCCITIRTALIKGGYAYVQAGGGWVNDSTPEGEFDETVNKAKAMLKAIALAESFAGR